MMASAAKSAESEGGAQCSAFSGGTSLVGGAATLPKSLPLPAIAARRSREMLPSGRQLPPHHYLPQQQEPALTHIYSPAFSVRSSSCALQSLRLGREVLKKRESRTTTLRWIRWGENTVGPCCREEIIIATLVYVMSHRMRLALGATSFEPQTEWLSEQCSAMEGPPPWHCPSVRQFWSMRA